MAKMFCATMIAPHRIELEDVERPEVDGNTVIVKVAGLGVCGSNLHFWNGHKKADFPIRGAGGHEYSGVVHEVGDHVTRVKPGDRVAIDPFHSLGCGNCVYCATGWFIHCRHPQVLGQSGFVEYLKLTEKGLHILPASVATHLAAIAEPAATPVSAVRRVGLRGGESVVVLGAGVLGIAAVGAAKALGAGKVIVTAKYEQQKQFAKQFGADVVISSDADNITALIQQQLGIGADVVIETVGGAAPTLQQAAEVVRPMGKIAVLGLWNEPVAVDSWQSVLKDITYLFCLTYGQHGVKTDFGFAVELMGTDKLPMHKLVSNVFPLEHISEAFSTASDKSTGAMKVIVTP